MPRLSLEQRHEEARLATLNDPADAGLAARWTLLHAAVCLKQHSACPVHPERGLTLTRNTLNQSTLFTCPVDHFQVAILDAVLFGRWDGWENLALQFLREHAIPTPEVVYDYDNHERPYRARIRAELDAQMGREALTALNLPHTAYQFNVNDYIAIGNEYFIVRDLDLGNHTIYLAPLPFDITQGAPAPIHRIDGVPRMTREIPMMPPPTLQDWAREARRVRNPGDTTYVPTPTRPIVEQPPINDYDRQLAEDRRRKRAR